ncbi:MAG TPA: hypothetical protein PKV72_01890 [Candidatus Peribacteria bacterium]|nr:hypothetical protein [Candidatus Peribacteria bacterium]
MNRNVPDPAGQVEEYSAADLQRWREGGERYRKFVAGLSARDKHLLNQEKDTEALGPCQAVFLGERAVELRSYRAGLRVQFERNDIRTTARYIYDPEAVRAVAAGHPEDFAGLVTEDPDGLISDLSAREIHLETHAAARGLLLGFPAEAVRFYRQTNTVRHQEVEMLLTKYIGGHPELWGRLFGGRRPEYADITAGMAGYVEEFGPLIGLEGAEIAQLKEQCLLERETVYFNVQGIHWSDRTPAVASHAKAARLRRAFAEAGLAV